MRVNKMMVIVGKICKKEREKKKKKKEEKEEEIRIVASFQIETLDVDVLIDVSIA